MRDGDVITIDLDKKLLQLEISDEELAERMQHIARPAGHEAAGTLKAYRAGVGSASEGAPWLL